jgi:methylmalonyl-CoA/ethylmalonyl-CoA epimerase
VKSIEQTLSVYTDILGLQLTGQEVIDDQKVKVAFVPIGESEIELLESTEPDGPIAKFISKYGEGIQHIALRVSDIEKTLVELKQKGVRLIDEKPRYGAGGAKIAFIHPKATKGVLIEICER